MIPVTKYYFYCRPSFVHEVSSPVASTLERRLTLKSTELQSAREKQREQAHQNEALRMETESLKKRLKDRDERLRITEDERNQMERDSSSYLAELNVCSRAIIVSNCFLI